MSHHHTFDNGVKVVPASVVSDPDTDGAFFVFAADGDSDNVIMQPAKKAPAEDDADFVRA